MKHNKLSYLLAFTALTLLSSVSRAEDQNGNPSDKSHAPGIAAMAGLVTGTYTFTQAVRRSTQIDARIYHNNREIERIQSPQRQIKTNLTAKDLERINALKLENRELSKKANYAVAKVAATFTAAGAVPFLVDAVVNGHQVNQNLEKAQAVSQPGASQTSTPEMTSARAAQ
jgi:hypothetical protein